MVLPQQREEREEKQAKEQEDYGLLINWEHPVILTLASLNVLFIVIIVLLVRRNKRTSKRLREHQNRHSDEGAKNIYSPCPTVGGGGQENGKLGRMRRREDQEEEEESSETSELSSRRGGTDTSYCSYSPSPSLQPPQPSYIPATYPLVHPTVVGFNTPPHHPHPSYSPSPMLHPANPCQHSPHPHSHQQHYPAPNNFPNNSCCNSTFRVLTSSPPPPTPPPTGSIHSPSPLFPSESSSETSAFLRRDNHM